MAMLFFVKSFVKDNVSSIIGLISTIVIIIIGYKLNLIVQKSNPKPSHSATKKAIEGEIMENGSANTKDNDNKTGEANSNIITQHKDTNNNNNNNNKCKNGMHHRRNHRICSCECKTYNKLSTNIMHEYSALKKECLNDTHMLLTSELLDVLIYGFCCCCCVDNGIPPDIISLIYLYYCNNLYTQIFVVKGSHKGRNPLLNKIECINLNYKISYDINTYNIDDFEEYNHNRDRDDHELILSTMDRNWDTEENGICFVANINTSQLIPKYVQHKIDNMYSILCKGDNTHAYFNHSNRYNAIFKCAGMTALGSNLSLNSNASMIIFKEDSFKENHNNIVGFEIDLPDLPRSQTYCAQTVYSSQYGLITNCRDNAFLFDIKQYVQTYDDHEEDIEQIYWNKLPPMLNQRNWASSLCVIGSDESKLFVCSGDGATTKSVEIYNICENKWYLMREMNDSFLMQSGIYYDSMSERIYVCGGYKTEQKITYYEIEKDEWFDLPDTKYKHSEYPSIWCNKFQINHILYINGNTRNDLGVTEYMDLRCCNPDNKIWNLCCNNMQINQYIQTPQLYKHNNGEKFTNHHRTQSNYYPMQIRRTIV